jgi:hypothetical protein
MGIGVGIFLLVLGLIEMFAIKVTIPGVDEYALGLILIGAGILSIVLGLFASRNAGRTRVVEERHVS